MFYPNTHSAHGLTLSATFLLPFQVKLVAYYYDAANVWLRIVC